jgi:hypothetical protein
MGYFDYPANDSRIDEWLVKRRCKMTSSENYKLLPTDKQQNGSLWSATAKTYIETKAIEMSTKYFQRPELDEVESLRHGKVNELPAAERYMQETKNYSMTYLGDENPTFIPCQIIVGESGGSPDIVSIVDNGIGNGLVNIEYGAEIKNPVNPAYHFRRLSWKDQWDIKEKYISCYTQIQDLIRISGAYGWDFISFDERQLSRAKQIKIIEVKPDRKFIDNLEMRIRLAVKEKYKVFSSHMGTEIKNKEDYVNFINQ